MSKMGIIFGKYPEKSSKDMVNEWCRILKKESCILERQLSEIQREEQKTKRSLKDADVKGDKKMCAILAKEIARSQEANTKIHTNKAHLNSIQMQLKEQLAVLRMTGSLEKSTEVMQAMQALVLVPQFASTMQEMSKEMKRAGLIETSINNTIARVDGDELEPSEANKIYRDDVSTMPWILKFFFGVSFVSLFLMVRKTRIMSFIFSKKIS